MLIFEVCAVILETDFTVIFKSVVLPKYETVRVCSPIISLSISETV